MQSVYIVDGARTPFLKARGKIGPFTASDLGVLASRQLLARHPVNPEELSEVITGCVMPSPDEANISRYIALRVGCGNRVPAWTVQRNCASGMQAIDTAYQNILSGRSKIVLAGGTDAMSHAPLLFNAKMTNWLSAVMTAKTPVQKLAMLPKFRPGFLAPVIALLKGLTDNYVGLNMGQTAEEVAYRFDISRDEMDAFAAESHRRVVEAQQNEALKEIVAIIDHHGKAYEHDDGVRADSTVEKLAKLRPFFDKKFGKVTAANSSQVTDGAAFTLIADEKSVKKYNLPVIARIVDTEWAALNPSQMGLGPVHAMTPLLKRHKLSIDDIDNFEINEAFAAQVIGCVRAWEDKSYCKDELGLSKPFGTIPAEKLNVDGGAIALGHPVGASGARITLHLADVLQRNKGKYGVASICIGGGQGGAVLIERV